MTLLARLEQTNHWLWYGGLIGLLGVLLILSPAEATLGNVVKIVYLHGALQRVAMLAYSVAGVLGIAQVVLARSSLARWTQAAMEMAVALWIAHFVVSLPAQVLAWGGITLSEPHVASATWILLGTLLVYVVARWMEHPVWMAFAAVVNALLVLFVLRGAVNILHPLNPIFGSDSPAIILFYLAITLVILVLALLLTWERVRWLARKFGH